MNTNTTTFATFLGAVGYSLDEVQGHHHRMFVDDAFARSREYADFWAKLNRGEYEAKEYKRLGKGGKEIWIIAQINGIQSTIATAVEEQTATTNEISRNVAEAAQGSAEIAENITAVATAAQSATEGAADTERSAVQLSDLATSLQDLVGRFTV